MPVWLQVLGALVLLITFLGSAVVFLRGSADKGTIETLGKNNQALSERVALLERDNGEMKARIGSLERENATLLAQRPSAEVLTEIRRDLTAHVNDTTNHNAKTQALLMAVATALGEQHGH